MLKGTYPRRSRPRELVDLIGKFVGNGTGQPTNFLRPDGQTAFKGLTLTRTGAGLYTLQMVDGSIPFIAQCDVNITSTTQKWVAQVLTEVPSTGTVTLNLSVGGTATDPSTAETINVVLLVADAGQP